MDKYIDGKIKKHTTQSPFLLFKSSFDRVVGTEQEVVYDRLQVLRSLLLHSRFKRDPLNDLQNHFSISHTGV